MSFSFRDRAQQDLPYGDLREFVPFRGHRIVVKEGMGTAEDMHRLVTYWFDEFLTLIRRDDPQEKSDALAGDAA